MNSVDPCFCQYFHILLCITSSQNDNRTKPFFLFFLHFPDSNCIEDFYIKVITFQEKKKERLCPLVILTASDAKEDVEILTKARIHAVHLKSDRIDLVAETIKNEIIDYKKKEFEENQLKII